MRKNSMARPRRGVGRVCTRDLASATLTAAAWWRLRISDKTVRNHVTNIFWKIGATSRAEAIVRAREAGIGIDTSGAA